MRVAAMDESLRLARQRRRSGTCCFGRGGDEDMGVEDARLVVQAKEEGMQVGLVWWRAGGMERISRHPWGW